MFFSFKTRFLKFVVAFLTVILIPFLFPIDVFAKVEMNIAAPSAILVEATSGKVLYEKNPKEIRSCASITKVMTLLLVMEALDSGKISLAENVTASEHASSMGGSDIWLEVGESMTVHELIKAVVVASANDAAVALAEHISGSEDIFVSQMNKRASELSMSDTVFKNCNGLDEEGHVTSAYDIAIMSRELIKHKLIFDYSSIWIDYLRDGKTQLVNTNKLLKTYRGITGLKTGTTSGAGCCISATAQRDKLSLIAVVLGDKTAKERFSDASMLLDYGFANYTMLTPVVEDNLLTPVKVCNGMNPFVNVKFEKFGDVLIPKGQEKNVTNSIEIADEVRAPVETGQVLGKLIYKVEDEVLVEYKIVADEPVDEINFELAIKKFLKSILAI
ncbi:MAG: D-alanyl-D-alanine carboxypeptidase DacF [Eubacteriales bacterium SKADARSKE-1]|nr:D-alanyl-D-alanine carboxypeptidase DacF [Eubacteriales bacterium SKADARSKE-1]